MPRAPTRGAGAGSIAALIDALARAVHPGLAPDCTLLLDLPVAAGLARARARTGAAADRFEAETVEFFEKVRAGYLALARSRAASASRSSTPTGRSRTVERRVAEILARHCTPTAAPP